MRRVNATVLCFYYPMLRYVYITQYRGISVGLDKFKMLDLWTAISFRQGNLYNLLGSGKYMQANTQQTQNICITFVQRRPNVFDVGPTLYKCYTNMLRFLGSRRFALCLQTEDVGPMLG